MRGKRKFTWFPTLGTTSAVGSPLSGASFTIEVAPPSGEGPNGQGSVTTLIFPIVPDRPREPSAGQADSLGGELALELGTEWFCERIVGSLFIGFRVPDTGEIVPNSVLVAAGFFVARAADDDAGGGSSQPIGSASAAERNNNYSPLHPDTVREPWMWRKSWILGGAPRVADGFSTFPNANAFYGSLGDGPKVDVKSVRRIGQDDRLFFTVSTVCLKGPSEGLTPATLDGMLDVRVLGGLRKAKGTGKF